MRKGGLDMPELGEIKKGREIGKNAPWQNYIWHACIDCGKERWVQFRGGKPASERCFTCGINNYGQYTLVGKLKGQEDYVKDLVRQMGVSSVMTIYHIKHRPSFIKWLEANDADIPPEPLENISGGEKDKWARDNREYILWCVKQFGKDWAKANFHFTHDTLERVIRYDKHKKPTRLQDTGLNMEKIIEVIAEIEKEYDILKTQVKIEHEAYIEAIERQGRLEEYVLNFTQEVVQQLSHNIAKSLMERVSDNDLPARIFEDRPKLELNTIESKAKVAH